MIKQSSPSETNSQILAGRSAGGVACHAFPVREEQSVHFCRHAAQIRHGSTPTASLVLSSVQEHLPSCSCERLKQSITQKKRELSTVPVHSDGETANSFSLRKLISSAASISCILSSLFPECCRGVCVCGGRRHRLIITSRTPTHIHAYYHGM